MTGIGPLQWPHKKKKDSRALQGKPNFLHKLYWRSRDALLRYKGHRIAVTASCVYRHFKCKVFFVNCFCSVQHLKCFRAFFLWGCVFAYLHNRPFVLNCMGSFCLNSTLHRYLAERKWRRRGDGPAASSDDRRDAFSLLWRRQQLAGGWQEQHIMPIPPTMSHVLRLEICPLIACSPWSWNTITSSDSYNWLSS